MSEGPTFHTLQCTEEDDAYMVGIWHATLKKRRLLDSVELLVGDLERLEGVLVPVACVHVCDQNIYNMKRDTDYLCV